ncbi:MAG: hypothetical protein Q9220_004120 [cf. Caloplaca sp. 1 TL-2023]
MPREGVDTPDNEEHHEVEESAIANRAITKERGQAAADPVTAPPLPEEDIPPLPSEISPNEGQDDGWDPLWDESAQAFYFYNRFSGTTQWANPRVPEPQQPGPPGVGSHDRIPPIAKAPGTTTPPPQPQRPRTGGYDPAIHGDYDPTAPYAQEHQDPDEANSSTSNTAVQGDATYAATGTFNRFTGKWQASTITPDNHNDENKSKRQMNAYFDVDAAANSHHGKSLKAERSGKKLTKQELKAFKEKRKEKKEEKRRAWLRD